MNEYNFVNTIDQPTYYSVIGNPTLLDHTWTNLGRKYLSYVFSTPISDHLPTLTIIEDEIEKKKLSIIFRDYSINNKNKFLINILMKKINMSKKMQLIIIVMETWKNFVIGCNI